jgi:hypothetical protein
MTPANLREPKRLARVAIALWIAWAVVVWNVVFDHTIEVAGRAYLHAAALADQSGGPYARVDDWMRPAVSRGLWTAGLAAAALLALGLIGVRVSASRS